MAILTGIKKHYVRFIVYIVLKSQSLRWVTSMFDCENSILFYHEIVSIPIILFKILTRL